MSENNSDFGAFLAGFVIGGLVGAATALILAPQSGEQMREQIAHKGQELRQVSEERVQHYRELADNYAQDYREKADEVIAEARERVAHTGEVIQEQARIILEPGKGKSSDQASDEETAVA
jgi:gas vesicle protein